MCINTYKAIKIKKKSDDLKVLKNQHFLIGIQTDRPVKLNKSL